MSKTMVTLNRQELRALAVRVTVAWREVCIAGRFSLGKEHPAAELQRIAEKLIDLSNLP